MKSPFLRTTVKPSQGYDIKTLLGRMPTAGEVGIEIECEGNKFEKNNANLAPFWEFHQDHSLRGQDNAEYVLVKPIKFDQVPEAIDAIWKVMDKYGTVLDVSNRTSVHVHLNCQKFHLNRLTAFMALYFIVEEALTEWCGDHRVGNLFCLRAKDAPGLVSQIKRFVRSDGKIELRDNLHYGGLNAHALMKYGSLEIRTLRGCTNPQTIIEWLTILRRLYDLSAEFQDPRDICGMFSAEGPATFFGTILGDTAMTVRQGISMTEEQIRDSLYDGIRLAQDICYCRDWSLYKPVELADDPFGRDPRKVMKKLSGMVAQSDAGGPFNQSANEFFSLATTANTLTPIHQVEAIPFPGYTEEPEEPEEIYDTDYDFDIDFDEEG